MASKNYFLRFGSDNPTNHSGLAPTFTVFVNQANGSTTAPAISELGSRGLYTFAYDIQGQIAFVVDGATTGLGTNDRYIVGALDLTDRLDQYGNTTIAIGTTGVATTIAYGNTTVALGTTNFALGTTNVALGTTGVALGTLNFALGTTNVALGTTNVAIGTTILALVTSDQGFGATLTAVIGNLTSAIGDSTTEPTTLFGFVRRAENWLEGTYNYTKASGVLQNYDKTGATLLTSLTIDDSGTNVTKT